MHIRPSIRIMKYAYYANDEFRSTGKNPKGVKVIKAEWVEIVEDEDPTPGINQVVVRDQILEGGKHRKRKVLRDKTMDEIEGEAYEEDRQFESTRLKNAYLLFKDNNATMAQVQRGLAYVFKYVV